MKESTTVEEAVKIAKDDGSCAIVDEEGNRIAVISIPQKPLPCPCEECYCGKSDGLSYNYFRKINVKRCEDGFHGISEWSPTDWACALAGEVGEACNLIKKMRRGENISVDDLAAELADIATYLDLLAARFDINLGEAMIRKFNEVSDRVGSSVKI